METNNFFNALLEENQANLFTIFASSTYDFYFLAKKYMKSKICRYIDSSYSSFHNAPPKLIFSYLLKECPEIKKHLSKSKVNPEAARWLGYFYRKWHNITNEFSSRIVCQLTPKDGITSYFVLHQTNENLAIELCKNRYSLKRNAHRKYEFKNNKIDYSNFDKNTFLSFAKNILVKFYNTKAFKSLEINYSRDIYYDLISVDKSIGVVFKLLEKCSQAILENAFKEENIEMMFSKYTADNSIIFILIKDKSEENVLNKSLSNFVKFYSQTRNKFDTVFVFNNNILYQINKKFQLTKFNLSVALSKIISNQTTL